jgi:UDP-N-acetylmuramoyl-L-alanyl-D-glutamate--2,6-diaminopimelate ligase
MALGALLEGWAGLPAEMADWPVPGLALDSRKVRPGDLFIALPGSRCHGLAYAQDAVVRGAAAVLYDAAAEAAGLDLGVPLLALDDLPGKLGGIADRFYGWPSQRLAVIGITGTNGKTSCSHYIAQALAADSPCAVMGTLGWGQPGALRATANTTPDALTVHGAMAQLAEEGFKALAMEVSSHGLHQGRVNGVRFQGAVYTNISRDHLDYHGYMAAYQAAKLELLRAEGLRFVAANADDASFEAVCRHLPEGVRLLPYSAEGRTECRVQNAQASSLKPALAAAGISLSAAGLSFTAHWQGQMALVRAPLFGHFNVDNLLAALAVLLGQGYSLAEAAARLAAARAVPGRMERFAQPEGPTVVIDYAHTPHALESVLRSLRGHCAGELHCVFGCGGDRDQGKRPEMGRIAVQWADRVWLTDDNPRHEDGAAIVAQILAGCGGSAKVQVQRDRRRAIAGAIAQTQPGDVVLVAGKGHETSQEVAGVLHPFSDRSTVEELLAEALPA